MNLTNLSYFQLHNNIFEEQNKSSGLPQPMGNVFRIFQSNTEFSVAKAKRPDKICARSYDEFSVKISYNRVSAAGSRRFFIYKFT